MFPNLSFRIPDGSREQHLLFVNDLWPHGFQCQHCQMSQGGITAWQWSQVVRHRLAAVRRHAVADNRDGLHGEATHLRRARGQDLLQGRPCNVSIHLWTHRFHALHGRNLHISVLVLASLCNRRTCRLRRIGPKHRQRQQRLAPQPCVLVRGGALRHGGGGLGRGLGAQVPQRHQRLVAQVAARVAQHPRQGCGGIGRRTVTHDAQTTAGADASEAIRHAAKEQGGQDLRRMHFHVLRQKGIVRDVRRHGFGCLDTFLGVVVVQMFYQHLHMVDHLLVRQVRHRAAGRAVARTLVVLFQPCLLFVLLLFFLPRHGSAHFTP